MVTGDDATIVRVSQVTLTRLSLVVYEEWRCDAARLRRRRCRCVGSMAAPPLLLLLPPLVVAAAASSSRPAADRGAASCCFPTAQRDTIVGGTERGRSNRSKQRHEKNTRDAGACLISRLLQSKKSSQSDRLAGELFRMTDRHHLR